MQIKPSCGTARTLYSDDTRRKVQRWFMRRVALTIAGSSVVVALITGLYHTDESFLAYWIHQCSSRSMYACEPPWWTHLLAAGSAGVLFGALLSPLVAFSKSRVRPTVYCRTCPGVGWVPDLAITKGHCPLCGSERFDYLGVRLSTSGMAMGLNAMPLPHVSVDVTGAELLAKSPHY